MHYKDHIRYKLSFCLFPYKDHIRYKLSLCFFPYKDHIRYKLSFCLFHYKDHIEVQALILCGGQGGGVWPHRTLQPPLGPSNPHSDLPTSPLDHHPPKAREEKGTQKPVYITKQTKQNQRIRKKTNQNLDTLPKKPKKTKIFIDGRGVE